MISSTKIQANERGEEPIEELVKLSNLSADEKTENAMLRSRIDEQCELIMILKQRADEALTKLKTTERIRDTLEEFRKNAQGAISAETRKCEMLDRRFNELADNHQELIKFKDEYKIENESLRKENAQLKADNERLFSDALQEKQLIVEDLEKQIEILKEKCALAEQNALECNHLMLENRKVLQERIDLTENNLNSTIVKLEQQVIDTERRLKEVTRKYNEQSNSIEDKEADKVERLEQLTKEKDELLALVMQRGKTIEEKVAENKKLESKAEEARKRQKEAEERFERESAAVDSNLQIIKLRKELMHSQDHMTEIDKKFEAYKTHTNKLLQQERDLNAKLRHLTA